jgi:Tfp pilus assembly protein PilF
MLRKRINVRGNGRWLDIEIAAVMIGLALTTSLAVAQSSQTKPSTPAPSQSQAAQSQTEPYDPMPAEKDVEVGTFYMHKGDLDAAIARFQDAIRLKPDYAKPYLLLAGSYEKKDEKDRAVKCYQDYLKEFPKAADVKKIREKIEKLSNEK